MLNIYFLYVNEYIIDFFYINFIYKIKNNSIVLRVTKNDLFIYNKERLNTSMYRMYYKMIFVQFNL